MEAQECCILGICCADQARVQALADKLQAGTHLNAHQALEAATFIRATYDLWPKGLTLQQVIDLAAAEAREYPYQQD
jgi:hypothetical protein